MGLESELDSFVTVISQYLLIPFNPGQHSPSAVIAVVLAYPLFLSFLLTSTAANLGRSMFRVVFETLERVCLLALMILALPAWISSWISSWLKRCSVRQKASTSCTFRPERQRARPAHDESSWERAADFVSELYPPLDILGLRPDASYAEIRGAYRRLMKIHHPDRFMKASPAEQERARRRTVEIRSAYEEALSHHPYIH